MATRTVPEDGGIIFWEASCRFLGKFLRRYIAWIMVWSKLKHPQTMAEPPLKRARVAPPTQSKRRGLLDVLPFELMHAIFGFLWNDEILGIRRVNRTVKELTRDHLAEPECNKLSDVPHVTITYLRLLAKQPLQKTKGDGFGFVTAMAVSKVHVDWLIWIACMMRATNVARYPAHLVRMSNWPFDWPKIHSWHVSRMRRGWAKQADENDIAVFKKHTCPDKTDHEIETFSEFGKMSYCECFAWQNLLQMWYARGIVDREDVQISHWYSRVMKPNKYVYFRIRKAALQRVLSVLELEYIDERFRFPK